MLKVSPCDRKIFDKFFNFLAIVSTICSFVLIFIEIPPLMKNKIGVLMLVVLAVAYLVIFISSNRLKRIDIDIDGSSVIVKEGDIFEEDGLKAIAFNEYFDTIVDGNIISPRSLNGLFIKKLFSDSPESLDRHISQYGFSDTEISELNKTRKIGKLQKYNIGTICVYNDYLLTAFSRFDEKNRAYLTMPDYLAFLNTFWDNVNAVYGQQCVSVPIFGSGITRIKEHKNIQDEDLLRIMLWTFKISETRFKYPARLSIIIHKDKMKKVNLFDVSYIKNGL